MINVLPRNFNSMATIQVRLKRHVSHASSYMFESVSRGNICEALTYLKDTPLHKKHNITINQEFLNDCANFNDSIDFIVDSEDEQFDLDHTVLNGDDQANHNSGVGKTSDNSFEDQAENVIGCDEILITPRYDSLEPSTIVIAPGQNKTPVPWHTEPDLEELSFPKIYCGYPVTTTNKISYAERVKSESRRSDRRSCVSTKILYMAKKKLELSCISNINTCLRKNKRKNVLTARQVLDERFLNSLVEVNDGFNVLKKVRNSPAYWDMKTKELMAMLRQLGKPTFFLTLSAAEHSWPELLT